MDGDRERWNAKWRDRAGELEPEAAFLSEYALLLPAAGKALDIAGGAGRNAIWLARRGFDVTLIDISDVALDKAERRAANLGLASRMRFIHADVDKELPLAPLFDLVLESHYLNRARRDDHADLLVDNGVFVAAHATVHNLERHAKPSREYLVEPGELASWARRRGMDILVAREDWTDAGRHEAVLIARRIAGVTEPASYEDSGPKHGPYR
jgi:tellurite methyltransferase